MNPKHKDHPEHRPLSQRDPSGDHTRCGYWGGRRKDGTPCVGPVVKGTKRCRMHGGLAGEQLAARGALSIEASKWMLDAHTSAGVDPRDLSLRLIAYWQWRLNEYGRMQAEAIEAAERLRQAHQAGQLLVAESAGELGVQVDDGDGGGDVPVTEAPALAAARADLERIFTSGGVAAIVGNRYDADRFGRVFAVDEGLRALETLVGQASDRLAKLCKDAISAGFEEQRIELAKTAGGMIVTVLTNVLRRLGFTPDEQVFALIDEEMAAVVGPGSSVGRGQ